MGKLFEHFLWNQFFWIVYKSVEIGKELVDVNVYILIYFYLLVHVYPVSFYFFFPKTTSRFIDNQSLN